MVWDELSGYMLCNTPVILVITGVQAINVSLHYIQQRSKVDVMIEIADRRTYMNQSLLMLIGRNYKFN